MLHSGIYNETNKQSYAAFSTNARFGTVISGLFCNLKSFAVVLGIPSAFGNSRLDGEGSLEFKALFVARSESSRKGPSPFEMVGTAVEELTIVLKLGRAGRSLISEAVEGQCIVVGIGICSIVSREELPGVVIESGAGFLRFLITSIESSDESGDWLRLLSRRCILDRLVLEDLDLDSVRDGVSVRCKRSSMARSVACRLSWFLLPLLLARLRVTLTLPSMTFAEGGG